jgi:hypothetical protein
MTVNPRSITDAERPWLEAWSLPVQVQLINLVRQRASNDVALALAGWLTGKYAGQDLAGMATKASYRKILRGLAAEGLAPEPVDVGASSRKSRRVRASVAASAATTAAAVARATPPQPPRMSVLMSTGPGPDQGFTRAACAAGGQLVQLAVWGPGGYVPDTCTPGPTTRPEHVLLAA